MSARWSADGKVREVMREVWYRVEDGRYAAPVDEFGESFGQGGVYVLIHEFPVVRHTPRGAWLDAYGRERFVLREARKRWACPTREEAAESFRARKKRQEEILRSSLARVEAAYRRNTSQDRGFYERVWFLIRDREDPTAEQPSFRVL